MVWFPQRTICYSTMARTAARRQYEALHEQAPWHNGTFEHWAKERSDNHPFRYDDGVTIGVSRHDLTPDDMFLGKSREVSPETLGG